MNSEFSPTLSNPIDKNLPNPNSNPSYPTKNYLTLPPIKRISAAEMQSRLCYHCNKPYSFSHKCKKMSINMLVTNEDQLDGGYKDQEVTTQNEGWEEGICIFHYKLCGSPTYQIVLIKGRAKKNMLS